MEWRDFFCVFMTGRMWSVYSLKDLILIFILFFLFSFLGIKLYLKLSAPSKKIHKREREKKTALCGSN